MAQMYDEQDLDRRALLSQMAPGQPKSTATTTATAAPGMAAPPTEPQPKPEAPAYANDAKGYLTNSLQGISDKVRGIQGQDDSVRKKYVEDHIRSILPELSSRGMNVADVKGEKINVGGTWIDLMRDVANGQGGGAAEVQWLVEDPNAGGAPPAMAAGAPSSFQGIQSLMPTDTNFYNTLQAKLQEVLGGPQATDREALLRLMGAQ